MNKIKFTIFTIAIFTNVFILIVDFFASWPSVWKIFCFLTIISLLIDTAYLTAILYFEIKDTIYPGYLRKNEYYAFLINNFYKYTAILTFSVCIGFWGLVLAGSEFMHLNTNPFNLALSVYVHLVITIVIWSDSYFTPRTFTDNLKVDFAVSVLGSILYNLFLNFLYRQFEIVIYPYIKIVDTRQSIVMSLISYMVTVIGYVIYKNVVKKANKLKVEEGLDTLI